MRIDAQNSSRRYNGRFDEWGKQSVQITSALKGKSVLLPTHFGCLVPLIVVGSRHVEARSGHSWTYVLARSYTSDASSLGGSPNGARLIDVATCLTCRTPLSPEFQQYNDGLLDSECS
jgi:hypothetical protein